MAKRLTRPSTAAHLIKIVEEMAVEAPKEAKRIACTDARLARVLYLHESLGGDKATFARVLGLDPDVVSTIAKKARELEGHGL